MFMMIPLQVKWKMYSLCPNTEERKKKMEKEPLLAGIQRCSGEIPLQAKMGRQPLSTTALLPFLNIWMSRSGRNVK